MKHIPIYTLLATLVVTGALADTQEVAKVTKDESVMAANVLCQNLPSPNDIKNIDSIYTDYIDQVSNLFGDNAVDITTHVVGINKDNQMRYILRSPLTVVGIKFNTININRVKSVDGNYYQIEASKPLTNEDKGNIKNIPIQDNLTVSTQNDTLNIICNVRVPIGKN